MTCLQRVRPPSPKPSPPNPTPTMTTELKAELKSLSLTQLAHFGSEYPQHWTAVFTELRRRDEAVKSLASEALDLVCRVEEAGWHKSETEAIRAALAEFTEAGR